MFEDDSGSGSGAVFSMVSVKMDISGGDAGTSDCRSGDTSVAASGAARSVTGTTGVSGGGDTAGRESGPGDSRTGAGGSRATEADDSALADTGMSKSGD